LSKGLEVLAVLASATAPLSIRQLADETHVARSTVHRAVVELRRAGLVETSGAGNYLGLRLFELGAHALQQNHLVEVARPVMEDLYERTRCVVQLGIVQGHDVMYVVRVGRQGHQLVASPVAGRIPATCAAIGKAILAYDEALLDDVIASGLKRRTRHSVTDPSALRAALAEVRTNGVATEFEEARMGLACVASAVFVEGVARAAISLTMPVADFDPQRLGPAVRTATARISRSLSTTRARN